MPNNILPEEKEILHSIESEYGFIISEKENIQNTVGFKLEEGKVVALGLCRKKITNIKNICKLKNLEILDLSQNNIINIPDEVKLLKKLKSLRLAGNSLT
tara:strand:+ start:4475 stop:4774 length:300 start_codon:yes stop_codon:yes gene_type:complete